MSLRPAHRSRRLVGSLVPRRPPADDVAWAHARLSEREAVLFDRMATVDRAHSLRVARAVAAELERRGMAGDASVAWVVPAALLHDVGKQVAGLGTYGRVVATLSAAVGGESMGPVWAERRGLTRRVGLYLQYPRLGADLLAVAGSVPEVVAWAAEHHQPPGEWSVPAEWGRVLSDADDTA